MSRDCDFHSRDYVSRFTGSEVDRAVRVALSMESSVVVLEAPEGCPLGSRLLLGQADTVAVYGAAFILLRIGSVGYLFVRSADGKSFVGQEFAKGNRWVATLNRETGVLEFSQTVIEPTHASYVAAGGKLSPDAYVARVQALVDADIPSAVVIAASSFNGKQDLGDKYAERISNAQQLLLIENDNSITLLTRIPDIDKEAAIFVTMPNSLGESYAVRFVYETRIGTLIPSFMNAYTYQQYVRSGGTRSIGDFTAMMLKLVDITAADSFVVKESSLGSRLSDTEIAKLAKASTVLVLGEGTNVTYTRSAYTGEASARFYNVDANTGAIKYLQYSESGQSLNYGDANILVPSYELYREKGGQKDRASFVRAFIESIDMASELITGVFATVNVDEIGKPLSGLSAELVNDASAIIIATPEYDEGSMYRFYPRLVTGNPAEVLFGAFAEDGVATVYSWNESTRVLSAVADASKYQVVTYMAYVNAGGTKAPAEFLAELVRVSDRPADYLYEAYQAVGGKRDQASFDKVFVDVLATTPIGLTTVLSAKDMESELSGAKVAEVTASGRLIVVEESGKFSIYLRSAIESPLAFYNIDATNGYVTRYELADGTFTKAVLSLFCYESYKLMGGTLERGDFDSALVYILDTPQEDYVFDAYKAMGGSLEKDDFFGLFVDIMDNTPEGLTVVVSAAALSAGEEMPEEVKSAGRLIVVSESAAPVVYLRAAGDGHVFYAVDAEALSLTRLELSEAGVFESTAQSVFCYSSYKLWGGVLESEDAYRKALLRAIDDPAGVAFAAYEVSGGKLSREEFLAAYVDVLSSVPVGLFKVVDASVLGEALSEEDGAAVEALGILGVKRNSHVQIFVRSDDTYADTSIVFASIDGITGNIVRVGYNPADRILQELPSVEALSLENYLAAGGKMSGFDDYIKRFVEIMDEVRPDQVRVSESEVDGATEVSLEKAALLDAAEYLTYTLESGVEYLMSRAKTAMGQYFMSPIAPDGSYFTIVWDSDARTLTYDDSNMVLLSYARYLAAGGVKSLDDFVSVLVSLVDSEVPAPIVLTEEQCTSGESLSEEVFAALQTASVMAYKTSAGVFYSLTRSESKDNEICFVSGSDVYGVTRGITIDIDSHVPSAYIAKSTAYNELGYVSAGGKKNLDDFYKALVVLIDTPDSIPFTTYSHAGGVIDEEDKFNAAFVKAIDAPTKSLYEAYVAAGGKLPEDEFFARLFVEIDTESSAPVELTYEMTDGVTPLSEAIRAQLKGAAAVVYISEYGDRVLMSRAAGDVTAKVYFVGPVLSDGSMSALVYDGPTGTCSSVYPYKQMLTYEQYQAAGGSMSLSEFVAALASVAAREAAAVVVDAEQLGSALSDELVSKISAAAVLLVKSSTGEYSIYTRESSAEPELEDSYMVSLRALPATADVTVVMNGKAGAVQQFAPGTRVEYSIMADGYDTISGVIESLSSDVSEMFLLGDVELDSRLLLTEDMTLRLQGHTISRTGGNDFVVLVKGAHVVIDGAGGSIQGDDNTVVAAGLDGVVDILDGTYISHSEGDECIYTDQNGIVNIYGGDFSAPKRSEAPDYYVLNANNAGTNWIYCFGGTFHGQNPADGDDVRGGSFVADGFKAEMIEDGVYTIVKMSQSEHLLSAAERGGVVELSEDITLPESLTVHGDMTINLGTHTLKAEGDTYGIVVRDGGKLTIKGSGRVESEDNTLVAANGSAVVTIEGGTFFTNNLENDNSLIYAAKGGAIYIKDGIFGMGKESTSRPGWYYVLNVQNNSGSTISVTGGKFRDYNPADGDDVMGGSFVAEGYESVQLPDNMWEVRPAASGIATLSAVRAVAVAASAASSVAFIGPMSAGGVAPRLELLPAYKLLVVSNSLSALTYEQYVAAGGTLSKATFISTLAKLVDDPYSLPYKAYVAHGGTLSEDEYWSKLNGLLEA